MSAVKPLRAAVLAAIQPGHSIPLPLTREQKQGFRDRDGKIALDVVRHLLAARSTAVQPSTPRESFPLVEEVFAAIARKLTGSDRFGIKRSRHLIRRLRAAGIIEDAGSYRQHYTRRGVSGFRVKLYKLGVEIRALTAPLRRKRAVGSRGRVKGGQRVRWWKHPLFGDLLGRPPPHLTKRQRRKMRSLDERGMGGGDACSASLPALRSARAWIVVLLPAYAGEAAVAELEQPAVPARPSEGEGCGRQPLPGLRPVAHPRQSARARRGHPDCRRRHP